jgi:hypothetical protein
VWITNKKEPGSFHEHTSKWRHPSGRQNTASSWCTSSLGAVKMLHGGHHVDGATASLGLTALMPRARIRSAPTHAFSFQKSIKHDQEKKARQEK